jgi:hypothetical protein
VGLPLGTNILNTPEASVTTEVLLLLSVMVAPERGEPSEVLTVPEIGCRLFCAWIPGESIIPSKKINQEVKVLVEFIISVC